MREVYTCVFVGRVRVLVGVFVGVCISVRGCLWVVGVWVHVGECSYRGTCWMHECVGSRVGMYPGRVGLCAWRVYGCSYVCVYMCGGCMCQHRGTGLGGVRSEGGVSSQWGVPVWRACMDECRCWALCMCQSVYQGVQVCAPAGVLVYPVLLPSRQLPASVSC